MLGSVIEMFYDVTLTLVCLLLGCRWQEHRVEHLQRVVALAHARAVSPGSAVSSLTAEQREIRPYEDYKPYLIFFSLIQLLYDDMFKVTIYCLDTSSLLNPCVFKYKYIIL